MRNFSIAVLAALVLASCTGGARIDCTVSDAPKAQLIVRQLDVNSYKTLDTVRTNAAGHMRYTVPVAAGEPEFVYIFYKDTRIASLLLNAGDVVTVTTDTLGHSNISGSEESVKLAQTEAASSRFWSRMLAGTTSAEVSRAYIDHYRESVKYVLENPRSLTVVPVLFEQLDPQTPLFNQYTDAILFRQAADSLMAVYPDSRFVKALDKEAARREQVLKVGNLVANAPRSGYPDVELPNTEGRKVSLSSLDAKAVLVHFWDSSVAAQKMFNLDVLVPLWNKWNPRGLEIYAIDVNPDKAVWASVVRAQNLPWVNVNGGYATVQAVSLYNVAGTPTSFLIADGTLTTTTVGGVDAISRELAKIL